MKQKIFYSCFILLLMGMFNQTYAQTIEVKSMSNFSTERPPASITVTLMEPLELDNRLTLNAGWILKGNLVDVVSPKRLKRDAGFSFKPTSYIDGGGKTHSISDDIVASYTVPLDKGKLAKNAALGVGSYFVKGLSAGVAAVQGAIENDEDNRLKSSVLSAYEATPLSYVQKGEELEIKTSDLFFLKFPDIKIDGN